MDLLPGDIHPPQHLVDCVPDRALARLCSRFECEFRLDLGLQLPEPFFLMPLEIREVAERRCSTIRRRFAATALHARE